MSNLKKRDLIILFIKCLSKKCNEKEKKTIEKNRKNIRVGLTGGVFDLIHLGHIKMLKQAKKHVDVLIVAVAREEMIRKKGRKPIHSLKERVELVNSIKYVDMALAGERNKEKILEKVKPDVFFYGYDQKEIIKPRNVEIIKLKPYKKSKLKTSIIEKHY